jgi:hypothetical protein
MNTSNNNHRLRIKFVDHRKIEFQKSKLKKVCAGCGWLFKPTKSIIFCCECRAGLIQNAKMQAAKAMLAAGGAYGHQ